MMIFLQFSDGLFKKKNIGWKNQKIHCYISLKKDFFIVNMSDFIVKLFKNDIGLKEIK